MVNEMQKMNNIFITSDEACRRDETCILSTVEFLDFIEQQQFDKITHDHFENFCYFFLGFGYGAALLHPGKANSTLLAKQLENFRTQLASLNEAVKTEEDGVQEKYDELFVRNIFERIEMLGEQITNQLDTLFEQTTEMYEKTPIFLPDSEEHRIINECLCNNAYPMSYMQGINTILTGEAITLEKLIKASTLIMEKALVIEFYDDIDKFNREPTIIEQVQRARNIFSFIRNTMVLDELFKNIFESQRGFIIPSEADVEEARKLEDEASSEAVNETESTEQGNSDESSSNNESEPRNLASPKLVEDELIELIERYDTVGAFLVALHQSEDGMNFQGFLQWIASSAQEEREKYPNRQYLETWVEEHIDAEIKLIGTEYNEKIKLLSVDIEESLIGRIVELVNALSDATITSKIEVKNVILSQLLDNGITTWHHLFDFLSTIETEHIRGYMYTTYKELYEIIETHHSMEQHAETITELQNYEVYVSILTRIKNYLLN